MMDTVYSVSLLAALLAGVCAIGVTLVAARRRRRWLKYAWPLLGAGILALSLSVTVHQRWGHGAKSPEPMAAAALVRAHPAFVVCAGLFVLGAAFAFAMTARTGSDRGAGAGR